MRLMQAQEESSCTEVFIPARLAKACRAADRLLKAFVVIAGLYIAGEVLYAFLSGAVAQAVR